MDFMYLGILGFLLVLAVFDLSVGVANDAVNFLSPAVGARAAKFRIVLLVAAIWHIYWCLYLERYDGHRATRHFTTHTL